MSEPLEPLGIDLGSGVSMAWMTWDVHGKIGLYEDHATPDGRECSGSVMFDLPIVRESFPGRSLWQVESWEPLTLTPSLLCRRCGNHGWIKEGRWVPA